MAEHEEKKVVETEAEVEVTETSSVTESTSKNVSGNKKKSDKKPFFLVRWGKRIAKWFRDLKSEAKKVVWPNGKQVFNNTVIVIIVVIVVALFVYVLDVTFAFIRDLIVNLI